MSSNGLALLSATSPAGQGTDPVHPVRLICLGLSAYDMVWTVDALPAGGGKIRALAFDEGGGGMAANASVVASRLGAEVHFWGRAGNDRSGAAMRDALAAEGIDVCRFRCFDGAASSISGVVVDAEGERSIVNFRGADLPTDPAWLPLDEVAEANAVLADPRWPEGAAALFDTARQAGVPTVLDGDVADDAVFDSLLPKVDYAIFSEPGLAGYAGQVDGAELARDAELTDLTRYVPQLEFARARGCGVAAATLGARGVVWLADSGFNHLPAIRVDVVDTTGAGDAFHGAVTFAIGAGLAMHDAFVFAGAVAAIKCTRAGGRAGAPNLQMTLQTLQRFEQLQ